MKRILLIISALAFLWGCEKIGSDEPVKDDTTIEDETPDTEAPDSLQTDYMLPEIIYASMTDEDEDKPQTRTVVGPDGKKILWQKGDAVSFFYGNVHNARYTYNGEDGVTSAELTKDDTKPGTNGDVLLKSQAVYPYNENVTVEYDKDAGLDKIILTYPTTQKYAANSFGKDANIMVAAGKNNEDDKLYFRNACGYLVIKLYGTASIKNITLSSVSGTDKIAGSAVVVASHDAVPVITMTDDASTAVTLDCSDSDAGVALGADAENATEFWFCLPPVTFTDGIKITVNDMSGNTYTKQTSKTVTIERNQIQPMAPLEFVSNAPAATKLWYTRSDDSTDIISFYDGKTNPFDAQITAHKRDGNKFVIEFASPLTTIKEYAFRDTKLATITLPEGITTIEKEAFRNTPLTEITIPGSINTIGVDVFYDCAQLTSVTFLPSPTKTPLSIGYMTYGTGELGAFYDTKLTSIALNRELIYTKGKNDKGEDIIFTPDEYDEGMFYHKNYKGVNSVTVTLGPQVETLSNYMFAYLPIQTLTIPGTVTTIQNDVFYKCTALTSLTFNPSPSGTALTMGYDTDDEDENLFQDNNTLETLNLNREIIYTLDESAIDTDSEGLFGGMETLTNVTLGDQVKTLHKYMFAGSRITNLEIPGSVNTIANDVFHNCTALTSLTFKPSPTKERLTIGFDTYGEDENLFQNYCPLTTLNLDRELDYTLTGVDTESEGLFGGMSKLTSVTLGDQVSTLTPFMFAGSGITSLNLNKVTTIGNSALANTKITSLTVPGCVKTIGNNVFDGCSSLAALTYMPSPNGEVLTHGYNDDSDDDGPFYASPLTSVTLNREIEYTFTSAANASEGLFGNRTTLTNVTIGDQVRTLSPYMFAHAQIPSITIPAGITAIAQNVFDECSALSSITFEESATALEIKGQGDDYGPFYDSPLKTIAYNRNFVYKKVNGDEFIPDSDAKGIFAISTSAKEKVEGTSVVTIGELIQTIPDYMCNNLAITELTIPNTVANLGMHAFLNCDRLSNITIQDDTNSLNLQTQRYSASGPFYNSPLTDIYLGREILYNGGAYKPGMSESGIFYSEKSAKVDEVNLSISNNVQTISPYMFAHLKLKSITIPASITSIGLNAFVECQSLSSIVFEDNTTPLKVCCHHTGSAKGPFYQSPLTSITLGRNINYVNSNGQPFTPSETDDGFFASEDTVESLSITLTNNVQIISEYMFAGRPITQLTIPASVTSIGKYAFYDCDALVSLNISFPTLAEGIFNDCDNLTSVTVSGNLDAINKNMFTGCPKMSTLNISGSVETIGDGAFDGFNLTSLNISGHVGTIGANAFDDNDNMTSFTVTSTGSVGTIGAHAFDDCDALTLDIQGTVNKVGAYAFSDCDAITTLSIRANVVEEYAYEDMDGLLSATLYGATVGNGVFNDCNALQTVVIDGGVNSIGDDAFYNCGKLSSVTFNESANKLTIGYQPGSDDVGPFYQSPLATINLNRELEPSATYKEELDNWDMGIFTTSHYNDSRLTTSVTLGSNVKTIWPYMFSHVRMQQLTIPASVTTIGNNAFDECRNLSSVTFESGSQELHIGFQDHSSDKGTFFDSPLTNINLDRELVYDYDDLNTWDEGIFATENYEDDDPDVTVTLGNNVKTILPYMFSCVRMRNVEIPTSVTYIGDMAFSYCYILTEVSCRKTIPPTLGKDVFYNDKDEYNNNRDFKVPYNSIDAYRSAWSQYEHRLWAYFDN